ncbi:putative lipoprotein [Tenacibaculum sp. 190130A14a]|uniref:Lipoprotein n=1 Tax=Tenacibaculum polynesiense TaxID=3137857 RepID=A0ABM9PDH0_9FLAO
MKVFVRFLSVLLVFSAMSCKGQKNTDSEKINKKEAHIDKAAVKIKSLSEFILQEDENIDYRIVKSLILEDKKVLSKKSVNTKETSVLFEKSLLKRIIPFWEGTKWSFEGHTAQPRKGEIACGYFVSTTLQHIGVNINRYKLAQQSPEHEAKILALDTSVINVAESSKEKNIELIRKRLPQGIHFIGFDQSHVGFILKREGQLYLIHSNYLDGKVGIENIENSAVFSSYLKFHLVELSTNESLLVKWLKGEEIKIEI